MMGGGFAGRRIPFWIFCDKQTKGNRLPVILCALNIFMLRAFRRRLLYPDAKKEDWHTSCFSDCRLHSGEVRM
jgi:hypothetical protein